MGLRHDDRVHRALVEAAPDAMLVVDPEGLIRFANAQAEAVFGYPGAAIVGQPVEMLVPARVAVGHGTHLGGYFGAPAVRPMGTGRQLHAVRRDGTEFPVDISLSPIELDGVTMACAAVRDVTERVRLAEQSERLRDELLATVSHELRTPLTSIIGYAELLEDLDDDLPPAARRVVEVIRRNADRELQLVNDLITLAFFDSETVSQVREPVDLGTVALQVAEDQLPRARGRQVALDTRVADETVVLGEARWLTEALDNLVANALKFTDEGGEVLLAVSGVGDQVLVEVSDTGMGIEADELERVFERLHRTQRVVDRQIQGAGLGLSIVNAIVVGSGGRIEVESVVDQGSVFRVWLPSASASAGG